MDVKTWKHFDFVLMLAVLGILGFGLAGINSATMAQQSSAAISWDSPVIRQTIYVALGLSLMLVVAGTDYQSYNNFAAVIYAASILSLLAVFIAGLEAHGARRWIDLGFIQVQPSEVAKVGTILALAKFFSDREGRCGEFKVMLASISIAVLPALLVYIQPDLGSAVLFPIIWLGMAIMAGVRVVYIGLLMSLSVLSLPAVYVLLLAPYMQDRLATFVDPTRDPLGSGYNIIQSEIGVGSGGLLGKGLLNGTQSRLQFLRVQNTDFIFSVLGEELGFIGAIVLFSLFMVLLFRSLRSAMISRDSFGRLIATGVVVLIISQVFINVGVNVRLLPVTGIPLPLVSSGGTSLMATLIALGMVQSIAMRHEKPKF
ncbi:MAG: rod shape-determining protein RodA [Dehalococcoidia bacterium]|nr:rod shape-determining protein RodA [Dehalococcoidia bacterium]